MDEKLPLLNIEPAFWRAARAFVARRETRLSDSCEATVDRKPRDSCAGNYTARWAPAPEMPMPSNES